MGTWQWFGLLTPLLYYCLDCRRNRYKNFMNFIRDICKWQLIHLFRGACAVKENAGCGSTPEASTKFCIDSDEWLKRSRVRIFFCARKFTNRNGSRWRWSVTDGKYMYLFSSITKIISLFHKSKRAIKIAKCTFTGFGCVSFHWYAIITSVRLYQVYEYRRYIICFDIAMNLSKQFRPVKKLQ